MISSGEYLNFLSIDKWTIIFNLLNTLILYYIIKRLLFKPVNKIINDRKMEIKKDYDMANEKLLNANELKSVYEKKMKDTHKQANEIINSAKASANKQYDIIVKEAKDKADILIKKANDEIELESKKAINNIKAQVVDMSILMASKVIKKEIDKDSHKEIIDKFFDEVKTK